MPRSLGMPAPSIRRGLSFVFIDDPSGLLFVFLGHGTTPRTLPGAVWWRALIPQGPGACGTIRIATGIEACCINCLTAAPRHRSRLHRSAAFFLPQRFHFTALLRPHSGNDLVVGGGGRALQAKPCISRPFGGIDPPYGRDHRFEAATSQPPGSGRYLQSPGLKGEKPGRLFLCQPHPYLQTMSLRPRTRPKLDPCL
jgi:hypothetical protein